MEEAALGQDVHHGGGDPGDSGDGGDSGGDDESEDSDFEEENDHQGNAPPSSRQFLSPVSAVTAI